MKMGENDLGLELQQVILNEFFAVLECVVFLKGFYLFCVHTCLCANVLSYVG